MFNVKDLEVFISLSIIFQPIKLALRIAGDEKTFNFQLHHNMENKRANEQIIFFLIISQE